MKYKSDWPEAAERLTALWHGRCLDRPCISVIAPSRKRVQGPPPPEKAENRWLDPSWVLADLQARLESTWWGGEAIPSYLTMGGWTVCLGGRPHFDRHTIWFDTGPVDFSQPSPFRNRPGDPWIGKYERLYTRVAEYAGKDDFLVGRPCQLPANDLLSMHMGTEAFMMALMDHPGWMRQAIVDGAADQLRVRDRLRDAIQDRHDFWYGNGGWMPFWAPEPYTGMQSDVSCMLSPDMFEEFVMPELGTYGAWLDAIWYHLDGGDARQHLPRLLSLPYLRVLQYTPRPSEPPNGPAHLDFYRQVQKAGKILHIQAPKQNVEPLVKALDPGRLMLDVGCDSIEEGQELLESVRRWSGARSWKP